MLGLPKPKQDELPADYAHRIGQWFLSWKKADKSLGQFFTPVEVARFMASQLPSQTSRVRVLDAGAGFGVLSCALLEFIDCDIELHAYEIDPDVAFYLDACLAYAQRWSQTQGRQLRYTVLCEDFVLAQADALYWSTSNPFDIVVSNPPYLKLSKSDARARAAERVVHGQPNLYALFMAVGAALLREGGCVLYITPRSYSAGAYFSRFRDYFFAYMRPRVLHVFESRREVFDAVLQESLILLAQRSSQSSDVYLSSSAGIQDLGRAQHRIKPMGEILDSDNVLHLPLTDHDDAIVKLVQSWSGNLREYGLEISTGPVVPFRATPLITDSGAVPTTHAPLLWMQNIQAMRCIFPARRQGQYLRLEGADKLLLPNQNYVLLRRFSAKEERRRLVAAPYFGELDGAFIGIENHLNYIYRPNGQLTDEETLGLARLLNSSLLDTYFRVFSGNTQVNATELRKLPLPPLVTIIELGCLAADSDTGMDALVNAVLGTYA
jgi:adenine-specific DNA-methyltransferase